jgi:hypothetical protein
MLIPDDQVIIQRSEGEQFCLLGYNVVKSVKVDGRFGGTCRLHSKPRKKQTIVKQLASGDSLLSVDFQRTTPEDRALRNHRCENLKSYD